MTRCFAGSEKGRGREGCTFLTFKLVGGSGEKGRFRLNWGTERASRGVLCQHNLWGWVWSKRKKERKLGFRGGGGEKGDRFKNFIVVSATNKE